MQVEIRAIDGNWDSGFALHKHVLNSVFTGDDANGRATFDTTRSDPGEALFRLKYRSDWGQVTPLARAIVDHIVPLVGKFGFIVPMPASNQRARQPVNAVAKEVSEITKRPLFENLLIKSSQEGAPQLKNMNGKEEKVAALAGRFAIDESAITSVGRWNVLLIDDLYDTGASMEAACAALRTCSKVDKIFIAAMTWK